MRSSSHATKVVCMAIRAALFAIKPKPKKPSKKLGSKSIVPETPTKKVRGSRHGSTPSLRTPHVMPTAEASAVFKPSTARSKHVRSPTLPPRDSTSKRQSTPYPTPFGKLFCWGRFKDSTTKKSQRRSILAPTTRGLESLVHAANYVKPSRSSPNE